MEKAGISRRNRPMTSLKKIKNMFVFVCSSSYQHKPSFCWVRKGRTLPYQQHQALHQATAREGSTAQAAHLPLPCFPEGSTVDPLPLPQAPFHMGGRLCRAVFKQDLGHGFPSSGWWFIAHRCAGESRCLCRISKQKCAGKPASTLWTPLPGTDGNPCSPKPG